MEWIYLVLIAAVLVFGIGVVLWNRRGGSVQSAPVAPSSAGAGQAHEGRGTRAAPVEVDEPLEAAVEHGDVAPVEVGPAERPSFRSRMSKARSTFTGALLGIAGRSGITNDTWDDLEEALLRADVGVRVPNELLDGLRARVKSKEITEPGQLVDALRAEMVSRLQGAERGLTFEPGDADSPNVWLFVGVNGVGKTTTIGKVGALQAEAGRSVLMAAGDTFRAAARRAAHHLGRAQRGRDRARQRGRRPQRGHLRRHRAGQRPPHRPGAGRHGRPTAHQDQPDGRTAQGAPRRAKGKGRVTEVLLVIDATTGQNGLTPGSRVRRCHRGHRRGAHQARRLGQGRHRVRHRDRARPAGEAGRPRRDHRRPGGVRPPPSSSTHSSASTDLVSTCAREIGNRHAPARRRKQ
jgi:fused signal recognition particle receptor